MRASRPLAAALSRCVVLVPVRGAGWCARGRGGRGVRGRRLAAADGGPAATITADTRLSVAMVALRARSGLRPPGRAGAGVVVVVCMPGASPQHSWARSGSGEPRGAHPALRPRMPPSALRAATGGLRRPRRFCSARSASRRPGSPRPARAARRPWTLQPRQHVTQAGDPRTQRVKCGSTDLVLVQWSLGYLGESCKCTDRRLDLF
jgi:hypothetical protein